jgi:RNA polymerase sigma factor (sigma-70 family)
MGAGEKERRAAVSDLYPQLLRQVRNACRSGGLYHRPEEVDDVMQDVCIVILTKWHSFHAESNLGGWLGTIIKNRVVDTHRRGKRLVSVDQPQQDDDAPQWLIQPTSTPDPAHEDCVSRVLDQLNGEGAARAGSIRTIELIEFIVDYGTDTAALADFLNCSESAAKERKRYALQKFRELCVQFCESDDCAASQSR